MRALSLLSWTALALFPGLLSGCLLAAPDKALAPPEATAASGTPAATHEAAPPPAATHEAAPPAATEEPASPHAALPPGIVAPENTVEIVFVHHMGKDRLSVHAPPGAVVKNVSLSDDAIVVDDKELFEIGAGLEDVAARKRDVADLAAQKKATRIQEDENGILWSETGGKKKKTSYFVTWNIDAGSGMKHRCRSSHPLEKQEQAERVLAMCRTLRWLR